MDFENIIRLRQTLYCTVMLYKLEQGEFSLTMFLILQKLWILLAITSFYTSLPK